MAPVVRMTATLYVSQEDIRVNRDLNVNIDGSAREHSTQRYTRVRLKQVELVLFTLCDGSFVFCDVAAEISAQVMVRRQITRPICRIGPVVGTGLLWDPP